MYQITLDQNPDSKKNGWQKSKTCKGNLRQAKLQ